MVLEERTAQGQHRGFRLGAVALAATSLLLLGGCKGEILTPDGEPLRPGDSLPGGGGGGQDDNDRPANDWVWGDTETPLTCDDGEIRVGASELRRLTHHEYDNTVRDLLGVTGRPSRAFTPDEKVGGYDSNANIDISELAVEQFMTVGETLAADAVGRLDALVPCDRAGDELGCARTFLTAFGRRAFRRPMAPDELERLMTVFETVRGAGTLNDAYRVTIGAVLQSPSFIYHVEFEGDPVEGVDDVIKLGPYAMASRLSYFFWNSMPDDDLFAAAERGDLATVEGVEAQARRMVMDGRAREALSSFHMQWLEIEHLETAEKDASVYPDFSPHLRDSMMAETEAFIEDLIQQGDGSLITLFTADYSFVDYALAELYGVEGVQRPIETVRVEAEVVGSDVGGGSGAAWNLWSRGRLTAPVSVASAGRYRLSANVWGDQAGPDRVQMTLGLEGGGGEAFTVVGGSREQAEVHTVEVELVEGENRVYVEFLNDYNDPIAGDRNLIVDWLEVEGPIGGSGTTLDDAMVRLPLPAGQRSGILTHASVLATHAKTNQSSPIHRGKFVRERLLCQTLPQPPNDVEIVPPELDPDLSTRDRFSRHSEDPACAGCHTLMDPIGFGFENYDGVGRYRTEEGGQPIDATGNLVATVDINGDFDGVHELGARLAESVEVRRCVAAQWFRFAIRRLESEHDLCSLQGAYEAFEASDYNIREFLVAVAVSDAFRHRRFPAETGEQQ